MSGSLPKPHWLRRFVKPTVAPFRFQAGFNLTERCHAIPDRTDDAAAARRCI
jgi:hypothetical protein